MKLLLSLLMLMSFSHALSIEGNHEETLSEDQLETLLKETEVDLEDEMEKARKILKEKKAEQASVAKEPAQLNETSEPSSKSEPFFFVGLGASAVGIEEIITDNIGDHTSTFGSGSGELRGGLIFGDFDTFVSLSGMSIERLDITKVNLHLQWRFATLGMFEPFLGITGGASIMTEGFEDKSIEPKQTSGEPKQTSGGNIGLQIGTHISLTENIMFEVALTSSTTNWDTKDANVTHVYKENQLNFAVEYRF
jgi:hypothetical protein